MRDEYTVPTRVKVIKKVGKGYDGCIFYCE